MSVCTMKNMINTKISLKKVVIMNMYPYCYVCQLEYSIILHIYVEVYFDFSRKQHIGYIFGFICLDLLAKLSR